MQGKMTSARHASHFISRSLGSTVKRCLVIKGDHRRVSDPQRYPNAQIFPSHSSPGLPGRCASERRPAGTGSAARRRSRLRFRALWSSFAPEVVPGLGLVRSGHGGAEVGKMALRGWAQRGWGCGQAWAPPVGGGCPELSAAQAPRLLGRR